MQILNFQAVNGCVLATEKKNKSILFEDHSTYKIEQVFLHEERQILPLTHYLHTQTRFSVDHWKHWHGVQWDGSRLQAPHPQSQKDGTGRMMLDFFGNLSNSHLHQDYYLMYHETIPTAQLVYRVALVMQEYTQSGGVGIIIIMSLS